MICNNVEIMRFGQKYGKNRILPLTKSVGCVKMLQESGPHFGQVRSHALRAGCIDFNYLAFIVSDAFLSNWGTSIFATIELLWTPAGRFIQEKIKNRQALMRSEVSFSDMFLVTPYEIGMNERIVLIGFIIEERIS